MFKTLLLTSLVNFQVSQDTVSLVDSNVILEKVEELRVTENFVKSIELLERVTANDSNYIKVQTELVDCLVRKGEIPRAKSLATELMSSSENLPSSFFFKVGSAFISAEESEEAIGIYKKGLESFPYNYVYSYNIGYVHYAQGEYDKAIPFLQDALRLNPYYSNSHQLLGNIMSRTNYRTKALLSYIAYLATKPNENWALVKMNNLVQDAFREEGSVDLQDSSNPFEHIDDILRSKLALDNRYESDIDFEAPVAQQVELLISLLEYKEDTNDFWMEFYVPYLQKIEENDLTAACVYFLLTSAKNDDVNKWLEKNEKQKNVWISIAGSELNKNRLKNVRTVLDSSGVFDHWYYDNKNLNIIGIWDGEKRIGPCEFYFSNGRLQAAGFYDAQGEKSGEWKYYYESGQLKTVQATKNGKASGKTVNYREDGSVQNSGFYDDSSPVGIWEWFYPCGNLSEQYPYEDGVGEGVGKTFYKTGELSGEYNLSNGQLHGAYSYYDKKGMVTKLLEYDSGLLEGPFKSYHPNGELSEKGRYKEGELEGEWESHYQNGTLQRRGIFQNGFPIGEWLSYHKNGNLSAREYYSDEGKLDGKAAYFDHDGKRQKEMEYLDGMLISYSFFDKKGGVLDQSSNDQGKMTFNEYYPFGEAQSTAELDSGKFDGEYMTYHENGVLESKGNYVHDQLHGPFEKFDKAGRIEKAMNYVSGNLTGYYREYHENGNVSEEGWLLEGNIRQRWVTYFLNGEVQSDQLYKDGELNGESRFYGPRGRLFEVEYYVDGIRTELKQFDSSGVVVNHLTIPQEGGKVVEKTPGGKVHRTLDESCGESTSNIKFYNSDGKVSAEYLVEHSKLVGYESHDENGTLRAEGGYLADERSGDWIFYFDNGQISTKAYYENGEREQKSFSYYQNGQLESVCERYLGYANGACNYYDPLGELQIKKIYHQGVGLRGFQHLQADGTLSDTLFIDKSADKQTVEMYFQNGKKSVSMNYSKGMYHGEVVYYSSDGKVVSRNNYLYGSSHGKSEHFYANGSLRYEANYVYDELHGDEKFFYQNGQLKEQSAWFYGMRDGWSIKYNRDGTIASKEFYWNDVAY